MKLLDRFLPKRKRAADPPRPATIKESLTLAESQTNTLVSNIILVLGIAGLLVWLLSRINLVQIRDDIITPVAWGMFFVYSMLYVVCYLNDGRGRWLRLMLMGAILGEAALLLVLWPNFQLLLLLPLVLATRYCSRSFILQLSALTTVLMFVCSTGAAAYSWLQNYPDVRLLSFAQQTSVLFSGRRVLNAGEYFTLKQYILSYYSTEMPITMMITLLFCACCVVVANHGYAMLQKQYELDQARNQLENALTENRLQLAESNSRIVLSQIRPHFMYNVLNSIYYLCEDDPQLAQEALLDFSDYLRCNLDVLNSTETVPFEQELQHINTYLRLEKMRFGDKLRVSMDIQEDEFMVPLLGVQPLVENAVKHGICPKPDGGTVSIRTYARPDAWVVEVLDDGMGFDPTAMQDDGRSHVGINSVRSRLQLLCGSRLEIKSAPGRGTAARITLPRVSAFASAQNRK